ncbi:MAG: hypoxanthine phosphoribosyltransferase [Reichenbachiella sp.]
MIQIQDKKFKEYLSEEEILKAVNSIGATINQDYQGKDLVLLGILNGSFMFVSDLMKKLTIQPNLSFIKLASYEGDQSSGSVKQLLGLDIDLDDKHVLIVEDIVDTGKTLTHIVKSLENEGAASVEVATLFLKPVVYDKSIALKYVGIEIENVFVVGYGMDYNGYGRELPELYQLDA